MSPLLWRVCWIACLTALTLTGIDWGLPKATTDAVLFASHAPWDGKTLARFDADRVDATKGADVDRDPVRPSSVPVLLNGTDADRAAIVRRYRLFSHQPDEMITFMALQQMNPSAGQLDPRLYQYGGAWIYPVGVLLKAASAMGFAELKADKAFYYDNPHAFGRFYVVARLYTLAAYVGAMVLAGMIVKRLTAGDDFAAAVGSIVVGLLPVVFAMGHEAKPHLAGSVLILATALAGARWVRTHQWRDALLCGALAGLAMGMVLSAVIVLLIPLTMVFLPRPPFATLTMDSPGRRFGMLVAALTMAGVAFALTNPYLVLHAITRDPVLASNLGNTKAMYAVGSLGELMRDGSGRMIEAISWPGVLLALGAFLLAVTRRQRVSPLGILLTIPTVIVLLQFFAFAANKPSEYARFALLPAMTLAVLGVWGLAMIHRNWVRYTAMVATPVAVFLAGTWPYVVAFAADTQPGNTRDEAAALLQREPADAIQLTAEPAPYATPPIDLWSRQIMLLPPSASPTGQVVIRAVDHPADLPPAPAGYRRQIVGDDRPAPITWANKPFEILTKASPAD